MVITFHDLGRRNLEVPLKPQAVKENQFYLWNGLNKRLRISMQRRIARNVYLLVIVGCKESRWFHQICHVVEFGSLGIEMVKFLQPLVPTCDDHFPFCCSSLLIACFPFRSLYKIHSDMFTSPVFNQNLKVEGKKTVFSDYNCKCLRLWRFPRILWPLGVS